MKLFLRIIHAPSLLAGLVRSGCRLVPCFRPTLDGGFLAVPLNCVRLVSGGLMAIHAPSLLLVASCRCLIPSGLNGLSRRFLFPGRGGCRYPWLFGGGARN